MKSDIYIILGMKKRAESEDLKHSYISALDIVHGKEEAIERYEFFQNHKGLHYDAFMIADIMDITISRKVVELNHVEPFDFLYKPVHRIDFPVEEQQ